MGSGLSPLRYPSLLTPSTTAFGGLGNLGSNSLGSGFGSASSGMFGSRETLPGSGSLYPGYQDPLNR